MQIGVVGTYTTNSNQQSPATTQANANEVKPAETSGIKSDQVQISTAAREKLNTEKKSVQPLTGGGVEPPVVQAYTGGGVEPPSLPGTGGGVEPPNK